MGSWRFLLSRRWGLFALAVVLIAYATWWLGEWQFGRLDDRKQNNAIIRSNENLAPTPVDRVLSPGGSVPRDDEWRVVTASGTYDTSDTVVVRYRTRDGEAGVDIVVPLVTDSGVSLLVDRGWLATDNQGADPSQLDIPAAPAGRVTITGYVRQDGTGESTEVTDNSVRAVSSTAIGAAQDRTVFPGFVELRSEDPAPADALEPVELPELDNGPHFFYGLQWWFFGVLAVFGFFYLLYDERRNGRRVSADPAAGTARPDAQEQPAYAPGPFGPRAAKRPKKVRQTNHPYARMKAEAEARAAAEEAARERAGAGDS